MRRVVATRTCGAGDDLAPSLDAIWAREFGGASNDIIRAKSAEMMKAMRLIRAAVGLSVGIALGLGSGRTMSAQMQGAPATALWSRPAAALAEQIAGILGPGQARLTMRNISGIANDSVPQIRALLEQDLKAHGIAIGGDESANSIRVTLSESARERIWVAEVVEGKTTQTALVEAGSVVERSAAPAAGITLRLQTILTSQQPVLAILETSGGLIVLEPEEVIFFAHANNGWREQAHVDIGQRRALSRDPHGMLTADATGAGFEAWLPGAACTGPDSPGQSPGDWAVNCGSSDDPWPIAKLENGPLQQKAFYNSGRNYFTGVMTPGAGADLPAFYSAAWMPRGNGASDLLVAGVDGRVSMIENGALKTMAGTRDWGSDLAVMDSSCGAGAQIIASSSGEAATDSLRAYEAQALEAIPASAPFEVGGAVTALWPAPDAKSVFVVVRTATSQYEVDRVTALCN